MNSTLSANIQQLTEREPLDPIHNTMTEITQERLPVRIYKRASQASIAAANEIADLIRKRAAEGRPCVLGLATGSTPSGIYEELVRMHREDDLSFAGVVTFGLDEFYPMDPSELQSYVRFLHEHLIDHVDIDPKNVHFPDGDGTQVGSTSSAAWTTKSRSSKRAASTCNCWASVATGHIGCNEPGSERNSRTRMITLDRVTRIDAASDFFRCRECSAPRDHDGRRHDFGSPPDSASRIRRRQGSRSLPKRSNRPAMPSVPSSFLQDHTNVQVLLDEAAASGLTRVHSPWLVGDIAWDQVTTRRAVITLATHVGKAILKLTEADYNEEGFQDLLASYGSAYDINLRVFRHLQSTHHRLARRKA